ncbi:MAG: M56 family metallopeptidase, partial [Prevotellaceae bacterium]|nr:M56 family metallopeptidase [Prevotellaceae bacterium]
MTFLTYLLESSVCAAVLWVAYYALLRKETHFAFNRFYLLSIIPFSGIIPLLRLPLLPPEEYSPVIFMEEFSAGPLAAPVTQSFSPVMPLLIIYFSGAGFVAFRFCRQLYLMRRIIAASRFSDTKNYSAFTFFRKIYINRSTLSAGDYEKILWHEQAHARQLHSVDLAIAQLFVMFQWFNPIAWQLKKSIVATHEYLADAQVLARGVDVNIYQKLLFRQTTGVHPEHANGFNYSLTKKRLIMMTKNNTGKFFALKLCCMLPAIVLPVALFGLSTAEMPSPVNTEKTVVATITPPDTLFINNGKSGATIITVSKSGETLVLSGNNEQLKEQLNDLSPENISSITVQKGAAAGNANKEEDTATITIIMKSGETLILSGTDEQLKEQLNDLSKDISPDNISSISVQDGIAAILTKSDETIEGKSDAKITIITKSGETLVLNGDDERLKEQLNDLSPDNISSITVQKGAAAGKAQTPPPPPLETAQADHSHKDTAKTKTVRFTVPIYQAGAVDVQPEYPGGVAKLSEFVRANLKYPIEAAKKNIQGRV